MNNGQSPQRVLEVGCGSRSPGAVGIDINPDATAADVRATSTALAFIDNALTRAHGPRHRTCGISQNDDEVHRVTKPVGKYIW